MHNFIACRFPCTAIARSLRTNGSAYSFRICSPGSFSLLRLPLGRPFPNLFPGSKGRPRGLFMVDSDLRDSLRHSGAISRSPAYPVDSSVRASCGSLHPVSCDLLERSAIVIERGLRSRKALPPHHDDVHVLGVQFHAVATATRRFGRDQCRATPKEGIIDDLAPTR